MTKKEIKKRYFDKVYANADIIECKCGCGVKIKSKDRYARDVRFISGHNGRKYQDPTQYKREWATRNSVSRTTYKRETRWKRKGELIIYKGGKSSLGHERHKN